MAKFVPIPIKTTDYVKTFQVEVDGKVWTMRTIGAGDEKAISQAERRIGLLDRLIKDEQATAEDLDLYDQLENRITDIVCNIFNDGTEDNNEVRQWVNSIPLGVTFKIIEDVAEAANKQDGKPKDNKSS